MLLQGWRSFQEGQFREIDRNRVRPHECQPSTVLDLAAPLIDRRFLAEVDAAGGEEVGDTVVRLEGDAVVGQQAPADLADKPGG